MPAIKRPRSWLTTCKDFSLVSPSALGVPLEFGSCAIGRIATRAWPV